MVQNQACIKVKNLITSQENFISRVKLMEQITSFALYDSYSILSLPGNFQIPRRNHESYSIINIISIKTYETKTYV